MADTPSSAELRAAMDILATDRVTPSSADLRAVKDAFAHYLGPLIEHARENEGRIAVSFVSDDHDKVVVGYEFGHEAEDSPMAGGAAYGLAPDLPEALRQVTETVGLRIQPYEAGHAFIPHDENITPHDDGTTSEMGV